MKNLKLISLLICLLLSINSVKAIEGTVEYNSVNIEYDKLSHAHYRHLGDAFLTRAERKGITDEERKFFYAEALGSYITATEINPDLIDLYGKIGYIYGRLKKYGLAQSYLNKGLNMDNKNPTVNFYFGGLTFDMQDFNKALKYYKMANKYGYKDKYTVLYRLGETNEKLGDLVKARGFYAKALALRPNNNVLKLKIRSIDDLKYQNSQYYYRKKPFYYND